MNTGERNRATEQSIVRDLAKSMADKVRESGVTICDEILFSGTKPRHFLFLLNSPRVERFPGSNTPQERQFKTLMSIRAQAAAGFDYDEDREPRLVSSSRFISIPDVGQDVIDGLSEGYERIRIKE